jgi:methyl coenzyme M reductase system subunit A2
MREKKAILEVSGIKKRYPLSSGGYSEALKGIDFAVYLGEIVGIIGRSGAGKTTLMRILRGVEPFDAGEIYMDGTVLTPRATYKEIQEVKEKTAIHLQRSFALWSENTVENVMVRLKALETGDEASGLPPEDTLDYQRYEQEAMKLLRLVGLEHKKEQAASTLSGGEKQRLVLARQLAIRPKILLLDEPLTMVSPKEKREGIEVVKRIHQQLGMTTLLVSHMPLVHKHLSERLIWLDEGVIKKEGDITQITEEFLNEMEESIPIGALPLDTRIPLFQLHQVSRQYYHYTLKRLFEIHDIDITVHRGEILGIIGASGVGKTVLMRILAGIELPNKGDVLYYADEDVGEGINLIELGIRSALVRQNMGIMHQEFGLTHHAEVGDIIRNRRKFKELSLDVVKKIKERFELSDVQLDFVFRLADMPGGTRSEILENMEISEDEILEIYAALPQKELNAEEVKPILELLDLPLEILKRKAYELSGGEKIRVALAVELASNPSLLILDEPFGDLDPITARKVSNIIKGVNKTLNTSFIIVSHDRELLSETAHRLILIKDGAIRMEIEKEELCNV